MIINKLTSDISLKRQWKKIPPHNWYSPIAKESSSNFLGLVLIFPTPLCGSLVLPDYIQNHESEPDDTQMQTILLS